MLDSMNMSPEPVQQSGQVWPDFLCRPKVSIVAPCYNEEDSLPVFVARMAAAARKAVGSDFELVLVNDGSRDRTWACISGLTLEFPEIVGVNLSRNHGHQLAVTAGL